MFYHGVDNKRMGISLKKEYVNGVLVVKRLSSRNMNLKLEIEGVLLCCQ